MAQAEFNLNGTALEDSTGEVIRPDQIMLLPEEVVEADVDAPPGPPAPPEDPPENWVLRCMMEDASDPFHAFQEYEHYFFGVNSESDCDVPEDELTNQ